MLVSIVPVDKLILVDVALVATELGTKEFEAGNSKVVSCPQTSPNISKARTDQAIESKVFFIVFSMGAWRTCDQIKYPLFRVQHSGKIAISSRLIGIKGKERNKTKQGIVW